MGFVCVCLNAYVFLMLFLCFLFSVSFFVLFSVFFLFSWLYFLKRKCWVGKELRRIWEEIKEGETVIIIYLMEKIIFQKVIFKRTLA